MNLAIRRSGRLGCRWPLLHASLCSLSHSFPLFFAVGTSSNPHDASRKFLRCFGSNGKSNEGGGDGGNGGDDEGQGDWRKNSEELPSWLRYSIAEREKREKAGEDVDGDIEGMHVRGQLGGIPSWMKKAREERQNVFDKEGMFTKENTKDMTSGEITRLKAVYAMLQEHIKVADGKKNALNPVRNPLLDARTLMAKKLPRVAVETLKEFRKQVNAKEADEAKIKNLHQAWFGGQQRNWNAALFPSLLIEPEDQEAWKKVHEQTLRPKSLNSLKYQKIHGFEDPAGDSQLSGDNIMKNLLGRGEEHQKEYDTRVSGPRQAVTVNQETRREGRRRLYVLRNQRGKVDVDFRAVGVLESFLSEGGKILPRPTTQLTAKSQRKLAKAVKRARQMALLAPEKNRKISLEEYEAYEALY